MSSVYKFYSEEPQERLNKFSAAFEALSVDSSNGKPKREMFFWQGTESVEDEDVDDDDDQVIHFTHPHPLELMELEEEDKIKCNICSLRIIGLAQACTSCNFFIHNSCFQLPQWIHHDSHAAHPLELLLPEHKRSGTFNRCDGCRTMAETGFYRCKICDHDVHVTCAVLYKTQRRNWNTFRLRYAVPLKGSVYCNVCRLKIPSDGWVYYDNENSTAAHVKCLGTSITVARVRERLNEIRAE